MSKKVYPIKCIDMALMVATYFDNYKDKSKSYIARLVKQGAFSINGVTYKDPTSIICLSYDGTWYFRTF